MTAAGRTILIVDDDVDLASSVGALLAGAGYDVVVANDASGAISTFAERSPAVAIVDFRLGHGPTGLDLVGAFKSRNPDTICILMTADTEQETTIQSLRAGIFEFLQKPASPRDLLRTAGAALEKSAQIARSRLELESLAQGVEKAQQAIGRKDAQLKILSREIREPLGMIVGYANLLSTADPLAMKRPELVELKTHLKSSSDMLVRVVTDTLALLKDGEPDGPQEVDEIALDKSLPRLVQWATTKAKPRRVGVVLSPLPALPVVETESHRLEKTIAHLLEYAIAIAAQGSKLRISVGSSGSELSVTVTEERPAIGDASGAREPAVERSAPSDGAAIALSYALTLAGLLGADVDVKRSALEGFRARLTLPVAAKAN